MGHRNPGAEQPPMMHPPRGRWHCQGSRNENASNADDGADPGALFQVLPTTAELPFDLRGRAGGSSLSLRRWRDSAEGVLQRLAFSRESHRMGKVGLDQLKPRLTVPWWPHYAGRLPQLSIWDSPHFDVEP